jgi:hypothetical protein
MGKKILLHDHRACVLSYSSCTFLLVRVFSTALITLMYKSYIALQAFYRILPRLCLCLFYYPIPTSLEMETDGGT